MSIDNTITEFFNGKNIQHNQSILTSFASSNDGLNWAFQHIQTQERIKVWYSLIVIDNWICKKPLELPLQQLSTLLLQAFQFHFQLNNKEAYTKIAVAYCGITRWTFGTNTACKEVIELTKKQETIDMGIFLLGIMAEEYRVIPKKAHIPSERIQQLKQIFENESVEVIEILVALIMNNRIDAIYTLIKYIGWVKTPILMNCGVFNLLDKTMMITDMLKPTLECLTEYLQTNTIPSEPQFHLSLLRLALNTIKQKNIPTHSALLLLMKTFEICLQRIPLDDSLLEIPRILNQFLNVQSDFTIISLCFEAWNVFLDTTIAESLCIAEEFIPIAQECCTQILKLLFNSTYSGIQMLDTSKIGNESSEYDLFVFSAYQVLLFLIDFQTVTILPIITNVISMSFNHLFNKNLNQFTDGDVCDLATTCRLFFEVSPNIVRNIYSLDQLQNTYQPLFNVLELIPFITNEMVIDVSRYLCASLRSLFPILHDLKSIQTSQYISQIVLKLLQIIEKCTITEVGKNIIELLTELMLSCRPEIYQIDIIMEILNNTIQFSNKYQFPFKKYIICSLSNVSIMPTPNIPNGQQQFEQRSIAYKQFIDEVIVKPFINCLQTNNYPSFNDYCRTIEIILKDKSDLTNSNKKMFLYPLLPLLTEILPTVLPNLPSIAIHSTLSMLHKLLISLHSSLDETVVVNLLEILMNMFTGKVLTIIQSNDKHLNKSLSLFIEIISLYIKEWKYRFKGDPSDLYSSTIFNAFNFCVNDIASSLSTNSVGNQLFRNAFSLLFTVIDVHWVDLSQHQDFFNMAATMILNGMTLPDIEMVRLIIDLLIALNNRRHVFSHQCFKSILPSFCVTILKILVDNEHSIDDLTNLLYTILDSDVPSLLQSFNTILNHFFNDFNLSPTQKNSISLLFTNATDLPTFSFSIQLFINDMNCYLPPKI